MEKITSDRRHFCRRLLSAGMLMGVGCPQLLAAAQKQQKHKFQMDAKMSFEQVFMFGYQGPVMLMKALRPQIGEEKFMKMLKETSYKLGEEEGRQMAKGLGDNSFAAWVAKNKEEEDYFGKHVNTGHIVEETAAAFEVRVSECLWAKTFRELEAGDIGYACVCTRGSAAGRGFNPKLKLIRNKNLMQGDDYCQYRWIVEA